MASESSSSQYAALKSCLGPDGNDGVSNPVKLMEHAGDPKEKIPILQVLEESAKDSDEEPLWKWAERRSNFKASMTYLVQSINQ